MVYLQEWSIAIDNKVLWAHASGGDGCVCGRERERGREGERERGGQGGRGGRGRMVKNVQRSRESTIAVRFFREYVFMSAAANESSGFVHEGQWGPAGRHSCALLCVEVRFGG